MTDDVQSAVEFLDAIYKGWTRDTSVAQQRADWDRAFARCASDWPIDRFRIGAIEAEWIAAADADAEHVILYLHGGGFRIGSIASHRDLIQRLSAAACVRVLAIDYRLSPEHPFPAAVEDAVEAYQWLLARGFAPARIAFAGDSAGGGLALSCMLAARDAGMALPCAAYLMSPWTDMTASGASYETRATSDPMHQRAMILGMAKGYLGKSADPATPLASPLFGDLGDLPPLLVHCGGREVILDDSTALAARARQAGVDVELAVFDPMIHVFQMFDALPEARAALQDAGRFLRNRLHGASKA